MRSPRDLKRRGGLPCLDFVNTLDWRGRKQSEEYLCTYDDLLEWSVLAGVLTQADSQRLLRTVAKPARAAALAHAVEFREAAYRILTAVLSGNLPEPRDQQDVNAVISDARSRAILQHERGAFSWVFADGPDDANLPLWVVSLSFADLLSSRLLQDVRQCGGPECGWLFLDSSRNHKRRWCSMAGCGNRAKARRHYARTR
jgi:predicted RNA-binding Zn ribbon-like protein